MLTRSDILHNFLAMTQDYVTTDTALRLGDEMGVTIDFTRIAD